MKQRTWPNRSDGSRFSSTFPLPNKNSSRKENVRARKHWIDDEISTGTPSNGLSNQIRLHTRSISSSTGGHDFSTLPYDVLAKIAASFALPSLRAASFVCKSWCDALRPLREAMVLLRWGKRFKHGRGGVRPNLEKALESFLKGASRGSTMAMVDAGLVYWETGKKEKALALYQRAAVLGDPAGQFNLGISLLQGGIFIFYCFYAIIELHFVFFFFRN